VRPRNVTVFTTLVVVASCLPEGEAGIGERLVFERGLGGPHFVGSRRSGDGPLAGMLYSRRHLGPSPPPEEGAGRRFSGPLEDLFFLASGGLPQRLIEHYAGPVRWDATGRLYVQREQLHRYEPETRRSYTSFELWRFELPTLASTRLGRVLEAELSAAGERLLYQTDQQRWVLQTIDDRQLALEGAQRAQLVGEEVYFLRAGALVRARDPDEPPATVAAGPFSRYRVIASAGGRTVFEASGETGGPQRLLVSSGAADPAARVVASGAALAGPVLSAEGRRLAWLERVSSEQGRVRILDLQAGTETAAELPLPAPPTWPPPAFSGPALPEPEPPVVREVAADMEFRPAHDELWVFLARQVCVLDGAGGLRTFGVPGLVESGDPAAEFVDPERLEQDGSGRYGGPPSTGRSRFSADGRFWTVVRGNSEGHLGDADEPGSDSTLLLFRDDEHQRSLLEVSPGRWAAFFSASAFSRSDLYLVDLPQRATRLLATNVTSMRFGRDRVVLLSRALGSSGGPGDLNVIDLATGTETLLARNVTSFAAAPACDGCDPTAPGARLLYVVHARVPWKHDGLWRGTLP
jgi:hypothetical protein